MGICILVLSFQLAPRVTALLFPQTDQPAHGEVIPTELWDWGCHCSAHEALTTSQAQGKLWLLFLNTWQNPLEGSAHLFCLPD